MTKRIIDADALLKWVKRHEIEDENETGHYVVISFDLEEKINELATPAPEPQESIFDADGWCKKLKLMPRRPESYKCLMWLKHKKTGGEIFKVVKTFIFPDWFYKYDLIAWRPLPTGGNNDSK